MRRTSTSTTSTAAGRFAAVYAALVAAHGVGDYWLQTGHQAQHKGTPGWPGRLACAAHVASYTAATCAATVAVSRLAGLRLGWRAIAAGQVVSAVTHYVADRRRPLQRLAQLAGSADFYHHGDGLASGAAHMDQSWHTAWLAAAAAVTALTADREAVAR